MVTDVNKRIDIARNINTPAEILVKLAEDENVNVRAIVALNKNTPVLILLTLLNEDDEDVRYWARKVFDERTSK